MKQTIEQVAERSGQNAGKGPVQKTIGCFQISVIDDENHRRDQIKKREYLTDRKTRDESARIDSKDRRPVVDELQLQDITRAAHDMPVGEHMSGPLLCPQIEQKPCHRHDGQKPPSISDFLRQCIFCILSGVHLKIQYSGDLTLPIITPYLKLIRLKNAGMTAAAVCLGFWIAQSCRSLPSLAGLCIAAGAATAFGNVVNDMRDLATDRISHPGRPLVRGEITMRAAGVFALLLAILSAGAAGLVSATHLVATLIPLALLLMYTRILKATPLFGNLAVSLLVAYPLLYGGLLAPAFHRLLIPASAAFLANTLREIVKDLQDEPGDRAAGLITTAALPRSAINAIVIIMGILFLVQLPAPLLLRQFGWFYGLVCLAVIAPMHGFWMVQWLMRDRRRNLPLLSALLKWEMLFGLLAMAGDQVLRGKW